MNTYLDIHILQSVPPSCLNRDDTGSPKSAFYGGVSRARVSSQCWKRAVRLDFFEHKDTKNIGRRTQRIVEELANIITAQAADLADSAQELATSAFNAAGIKVKEPKRKKSDSEDDSAKIPESGYLMFLSTVQLQNLAEKIIQIVRTEEDKSISKYKKDLKAIIQQDNSIDISLFGRMVADDTDLNVDASCQVAHALSTHAVMPEFDFFTAVDDVKNDSAGEDAGAGMMGTVEFNSATLYRFATINVAALQENLGSRAATLESIRQFIESFIRAMPTGKINTFANRNLPDVIVLAIRDDQPLSWVGAFEKPVVAKNDGIMKPSIEAMVNSSAEYEAMYGHRPILQVASTLPKYSAEVAKIAEVAPLPTTIDRLMETVSTRVEEK